MRRGQKANDKLERNLSPFCIRNGIWPYLISLCISEMRKYYYYYTPSDFFALILTGRVSMEISDSKSPLVSRTLLSILLNLNNAVV